ncbi:MAG: hypothetical protein JST90_02180 [Bacteroidetes bacterium]|nr:hypothetical protein [Bacteroidota bacterium]
MIFSYEGRMYQALGTAGEARRQDSITVIFNATTPTEAKEFTLLGLLDFPLANHCFQLWLLLSAGLYGLASADDTFVMGNFTVRKLKLPYFLLLVVLLVSMPLLAYTDLWLFGREVTGTVQSDTVQRYGTEMRMVSYQVGQAHYMTYFDHTRYLEADPGTEVEVRYLPFHPQRAAVMQLSDMYSSAYLSIMGIVLLFIAGWFYASRSILEEGTTA